MAKLKEVHMRYAAKPGVDAVFDLFKRLMNARDTINSKYPKEIDCTVSSPQSDIMSVFITEKQPGKLEDAAREYLLIAKSPSYRYRDELEYSQFGSDFSALEAALPLGKKLERKLKSLFLGKYVVDAK